MNPKMLQYIMGHSKIETTLDCYTHIGYDQVAYEFAKIEKQLYFVIFQDLDYVILR